MIVVDASVLVDVVIGEGRAVDRLVDGDLAAPHLLDAEVASAVRRLVAAGTADRSVADTWLDDLRAFEITRYAHLGLLERAWQLREHLTVYDALYVALAEALDAPLVTMDARLAAAPGTHATVEVIPPT